MDMTMLAKTLPSGQSLNERELLDNFKAAAQSITTLYRTSRTSSMQAYTAGYTAACSDLLSMIESGASPTQLKEWAEGRLEAETSEEKDPSPSPKHSPPPASSPNFERQPSPPTSFDFSFPSSAMRPPSPILAPVGLKRRHATMMETNINPGPDAGPVRKRVARR